jgi:hypothetical protein
MLMDKHNALNYSELAWDNFKICGKETSRESQ